MISTSIDVREVRRWRSARTAALIAIRAAARERASMRVSLSRRAVAEAIGTALLVLAVVGSGISATRLSPHDVGLQLFENAAATGLALVAIILALGPVSGAHLNPIVTAVDVALGGLTVAEGWAYAAAQVVGGAIGAVLANLMFSSPAIELSTRHRSGGGVLLGEAVATFGLILVISGLVRSGRASAVAFAVGAYIAGAYFFTSSTSFANPAVAIARSLSDTFAGIAPSSVPGFLLMELIGGGLGFVAVRLLYPSSPPGGVAAQREEAGDQRGSRKGWDR
jgi:glycerol uptake facilitator-like aquaporin